MIHVLNFREYCPPNSVIVNTTSRSTNWSQGLSPFFVGPCETYSDLTAKNLENLWQYSKVYPVHVDSNQDPTPEYFKWAEDGWSKTRADRYPMGKGAIPLYSWWDNKKLTYIEARKEIYIPKYAKAVCVTPAYKQLQELYESCLKENKNLILNDFDAFDHRGWEMSWDDVIDCETKKMGHAFVLAMMLEEFIIP